MRRALNNCNADLVKQYPDYVCARRLRRRRHRARSHLGRFMELETTHACRSSQPRRCSRPALMRRPCKNVVLVRTINSMTEFKQIIGRGTRVRDDYGKLFFNILDYTGSATRLFADPDFDGDPVQVTEEQMDANGETVGEPPSSRNRSPSSPTSMPPGTGLTFDDEGPAA